MGSRTQDIRALTFPHKMIVKAALLCYLVLTPAVFTFTVPEHAVAKKASSEVEARQFHEEPIINYGIWGFIAGLVDYAVRNSVTATTTTAAPRFRQKHKHHHKDKKEKQQRKKDKKAKRDQKKKEKEMENAMKAEVEAVVVEESVPVEVVEDAVAEIVADVE